MASFADTAWETEYAGEEDKEKTRLVGIEFEARIKPYNEIKEKEFEFLSEEWLNDEGIGNYESDYDDGEEIDYDIRSEWIWDELENKGIKVGGVGYDGGGKEFVTHPDSITLFKNGGSERFKKIVDMLKEYTEADTCSGTHINISKLESDHENTKSNLYWMSMVFGAQFQKIFGRRSHWARIPLPVNHFSTLDNEAKVFRAPIRRPSIKGMCLDPKGTIIVEKEGRWEFRGPKATHDINEVLAWIEFCNNVLEACSQKSITNVKFEDLLRGNYIEAYAMRLRDERAITYSDREMLIGKAGYVAIKQLDKTFE